jgi:hypothetical protein
MRVGARLLTFQGAVPAMPAPFKLGQLVSLKQCPDAPPGKVLRVVRSRVEVRWTGLDYVGKHDARSLVLIDNPSPNRRSQQ